MDSFSWTLLLHIRDKKREGRLNLIQSMMTYLLDGNNRIDTLQ